jgi:hypothetical protein
MFADNGGVIIGVVGGAILAAGLLSFSVLSRKRIEVR